MQCIQELDPFEYTPLLISLKSSPLSLYVCILKYLVFSTTKK